MVHVSFFDKSCRPCNLLSASLQIDLQDEWKLVTHIPWRGEDVTTQLSHEDMYYFVYMTPAGQRIGVHASNLLLKADSSHGSAEG